MIDGKILYIIVIIVIVIIVIVIIMAIVMGMNPNRRSENTNKCSLPPVTINDFRSSKDERRHRNDEKHIQERIMVQNFKEGKHKKIETKEKIKEENKEEGPELIAHDILEFEGKNKLFIQWKPNENCIGYAIYYNKGENWETATEKKVKMVSPETFHFETEELEGCWSIFVKTVDKNHKESLPSKIFTSCFV